MPAKGQTDNTYQFTLLDIGLKLLEPFTGAKKHHTLQCTYCSHTWVATPVSKVQAFKKYGHNGCPECNTKRITERNNVSRHQNIQTIKDKGLDVLSDWTGQRVADRDNTPVYITVKNTECGHIFTSTAINLLCTTTVCTVCGIKDRAEQLTQTSYDRSEEWQKTATEWKIYKSEVMKLSRKNYNKNKSTINPDNLPTGRAGTEGAYHIDHIVPIKYCYIHNIPVELVAHPTNLQMLGWRENVGSRDKLKSVIPTAFEGYINDTI